MTSRPLPAPPAGCSRPMTWPRPKSNPRPRSNPKAAMRRRNRARSRMPPRKAKASLTRRRMPASAPISRKWRARPPPKSPPRAKRMRRWTRRVRIAPAASSRPATAATRKRRTPHTPRPSTRRSTRPNCATGRNSRASVSSSIISCSICRVSSPNWPTACSASSWPSRPAPGTSISKKGCSMSAGSPASSPRPPRRSPTSGSATWIFAIPW